MVKTILLDTRESDNTFTTILVDRAAAAGYNVVMRTLPVGDIQYENIIIERKTVNDFYSSVAGDHMWDQIIHMKHNPNFNCIIAISGRIQDLWEINDIKINVFMGAHKRVMSMGIPLMWCANDSELVYKVLELFEHASPTHELVKRVQKNTKISLFIALPGIGLKNAKKLMKEYGSMEELVCASEKELKKLLGPKKGQDVYCALRT